MSMLESLQNSLKDTLEIHEFNYNVVIDTFINFMQYSRWENKEIIKALDISRGNNKVINDYIDSRIKLLYNGDRINENT